MSIVIDKEQENQNPVLRLEGHETDLIRELGKRLGSLHGYDRNIASADGRPELLEFWRSAKSQEQSNIDHLKEVINQHDLGNGI